MQSVDRPDKTGSKDVGNEDLGETPGGDESVVKRENPQLNVLELELEKQSVSQALS